MAKLALSPLLAVALSNALISVMRGSRDNMPAIFDDYIQVDEWTDGWVDGRVGGPKRKQTDLTDSSYAPLISLPLCRCVVLQDTCYESRAQTQEPDMLPTGGLE